MHQLQEVEHELMLKAKEEGINMEVHSIKSVEEIFPKAKLMICGGHAGRAHLKRLQKLAKCKTNSL